MLLYQLLEDDTRNLGKITVDVEGQKVFMNEKQILPMFVLSGTKIVIGKRYKTNRTLPQIVVDNLNIVNYTTYVKFLIYKYRVVAEETLVLTTKNLSAKENSPSQTTTVKTLKFSQLEKLVTDDGMFNTKLALSTLINIDTNKKNVSEYKHVDTETITFYSECIDNEEIADNYEDSLSELDFNMLTYTTANEIAQAEEKHYLKLILNDTYHKDDVALIYDIVRNVEGKQIGIEYKVHDVLASQKENPTKCIYTDKEVDKTKIVNKPSNVQLCVNYPTLAYFTEKVNTDKGGIEVFIYDNENKLLVSSCSLHSELAYYMIQDKKY